MIMNISKTAMLTFGMFVLVSTVLISNQAFAGSPTEAVGGLPVPVDVAALNGELAKQYSLWLIPAISAIGVGLFVLKRKF